MKIYLLCGKLQHGKDTLGNYIKKQYELRGEKACILHFSSSLKNYARDYFGWNPATDEKPRELLQRLGQEIIREKLHKPYFLIDRLCGDIEVLSSFFDVFIITDGRLPLEIETMKERFESVVTIHINRPNFETSDTEVNHHITETALDNYDKFDYKVENTTLEKLEKTAEEIVRKEEYSDEKND